MFDEQRTSDERAAVLDLVGRVIDAGSHYRVEEFDRLYAPGLRILMVPPSGEVASFDYDANVEFFRARAEHGAPSLSTERTVRHVELHGDEAVVVLDRVAAFTGEERTVVFTLWARRTRAGWRVERELAVVR